MATKRRAVKKVKIVKNNKKDTRISDKVFLCGNIYGKLSGMFITSLDRSKAISEWNSIPYIQDMYGTELIGYTTNLENLTATDAFVPKTYDEQLTGDIYYPVYENKVYEISQEKQSESYTSPISELCSDLQWLNEENVSLTISVDKGNFLKNSNLKIDFKNQSEDGEDITLLHTEQTLTCSGSFKASSVINGQEALSDVIDLNTSDNLSAKSFITSMQVKPRYDRVTDYEQYYYTQFCGTVYVSTEDEDDATHLENFAKVVAGKIPDNYVRIDKFNKQPLKSPYIFNKTDDVSKYYYESLGYDVDSILKTWNSEHPDQQAVPLLYVLSNSLQDVSVPRSQIYCYETTLQPSSSGWYKFIGANDDIGTIAIDDKLVFVSEQTGLSNEAFLSTLLEQIDDSSQIDADQVRLLSTQSEWFGSETWRSNAPQNAGIRNVQDLSGAERFKFDGSNVITQTPISATNLLGSIFRYEFPDAYYNGSYLNVSILPYSSGAYIKLLSYKSQENNSRYKCRIWASKRRLPFLEAWIDNTTPPPNPEKEIDYTTFNYLMLFDPDTEAVELSTKSYTNSLSNDANRNYPTMQDMIFIQSSNDTEHTVNGCNVLGYSDDFASKMTDNSNVSLKQLFAVSDLTEKDKENILKQIGSNSNLFTSCRSNGTQYWTVHGNYLPIVIEGPTKLYRTH